MAWWQIAQKTACTPSLTHTSYYSLTIAGSEWSWNSFSINASGTWNVCWIISSTSSWHVWSSIVIVHIECELLFLWLKVRRLSADKMFMNLSWHFLLQHYIQHCQCENYETFCRHMWLLKCMLIQRFITICFVCCLWTVWTSTCWSWEYVCELCVTKV